MHLAVIEISKQQCSPSWHIPVRISVVSPKVQLIGFSRPKSNSEVFVCDQVPVCVVDFANLIHADYLPVPFGFVASPSSEYYDLSDRRIPDRYALTSFRTAEPRSAIELPLFEQFALHAGELRPLSLHSCVTELFA